MLEGLDQIDWASLHHAYGTAEDIPQVLRDLASHDSRTSGDALDYLFTSIWHQDSVYEASVAAVPFLMELAENPSVPQRPMILWLLTELAMGALLTGVDEYLSSRGERGTRPEVIAGAEREHENCRAAHDAVANQIPNLLRLIHDEDQEVGSSAAYTLACFREQAANIVPRIITLLNEDLPDQVKASLILCLGMFGPDEDTTGLFRAMLESAAPAPMRLAAATVLARAWRDSAPQRAAAVLEAAAKNPGWDNMPSAWQCVALTFEPKSSQPFDSLYAPLFDQYATERQRAASKTYDYIYGYVCVP